MNLLSLKRRYRIQKQIRTSIETVWDEIDYFTGPVKEASSSSKNPGGNPSAPSPEARKDIWDFTAIEGREKLSANIQSAAFNAALRWFLMSWRKAALNVDAETRGWLDEESENAWNDIQDSDFDTEIGAALHEWCGPGNMFVSVEPLPPQISDGKDAKGKPTITEEWSGVDFTHHPLRDSYFEPDRRGDIRTFWRRYLWTAAQIVSFHEDKANEARTDAERKAWACPADIQDKYERGDVAPIEYVCCIFPRPDVIARKKVRYPAAPTNRAWGSVWWREATGEQVGEEGGYYERPIYWAPYLKITGTHWGFGPGNVVLPTAKYVNARKANIKTAEEKVIKPTVAVSERDVVGDVDLRPGGATITRGDPRTAMMVIESGTKFDVAYESLQGDQTDIRRIFHMDELALKESPAMTATEAQIRYELMNRILGKPLTFITSGIAGPIILAIIQMRIRMGASKPMPDKARKAGGIFNVEYQGPLARSQRTDEVAAIERGAQFVAALAQIFPEVRAAFKPVEAVKHIFKRLGVPASMIPSDTEIDAAIKQIQDQQNQAIQAKTEADKAKARNDNASAQATAGGQGMGGVPPPAGSAPLPLTLPTRQSAPLGVA